MRKRIPIKELSALLDGEAKDPEAIERLLQQYGDVARRHVELSRVSARVKALPGPETRPGFSGRVIAAIELHSSGLPRARRLPAAVFVAAGVALLTLITVVGLDDSVVPTAPTAPVALEEGVPALDEGSLVEELGQRLAEQAQSEFLVAGNFYGGPNPVEEYPEDILLAVAPADWFEPFGDFEAMPDYRAAMGTLSESEKDVFKQLLEEDAQVGVRGPNSREP